MCHELPHELGGFIVYRKLGFTVTRSLLLNVFAAVINNFGLFTGLALSGIITSTTDWLFALVAGHFIYVALCQCFRKPIEQVRRAVIENNQAGHRNAIVRNAQLVAQMKLQNEKQQVKYEALLLQRYNQIVANKTIMNKVDVLKNDKLQLKRENDNLRLQLKAVQLERDHQIKKNLLLAEEREHILDEWDRMSHGISLYKSPPAFIRFKF